jgi:hypothetical protein
MSGLHGSLDWLQKHRILEEQAKKVQIDVKGRASLYKKKLTV